MEPRFNIDPDTIIKYIVIVLVIIAIGISGDGVKGIFDDLEFIMKNIDWYDFFINPQNHIMIFTIIAAVITYFIINIIIDSNNQKNFRNLANAVRPFIERFYDLNPNAIKRDTNFAAALLKIKGEPYYYLACSKVTNMVNDNYKELGAKICHSSDIASKQLPILRLGFNLEWIKYDVPGYAQGKQTCAERKICAYILEDFKEKDLIDSELYIYSQMEPCSYCVQALQVMQSKKIKISLYFDQMIDELINAKVMLDEEYKDLYQIVESKRKYLEKLSNKKIAS